MANQNDGVLSLYPTAIVMFTVAMLQQATVKPSNINAHEKGFKCHAQPQTGAYSCWRCASYSAFILQFENNEVLFPFRSVLSEMLSLYFISDCNKNLYILNVKIWGRALFSLKCFHAQVF